MNLSKWPRTYRLLLVMAMLFLILFAISIVQHNAASRAKMTEPVPVSSMQIAPASHPPQSANAAAGAPSGTHWQRVGELFPDFDGLLPPGRYWLKMTIDQGDWSKQPSLYIYNVRYFQLFASGEKLYETNKPANTPTNPYYTWHLFTIDPNLRGHELVFYLDTEGMRLPLPTVRVTNAEHLFIWLFREEFSNYMLAALFLFCGTAAVFFCFKRRDRAYVYFALFAFSIGFASFVRNHTFMFISDNTWITYLHDLVLPFATYAFISFLGSLFPDLYPRSHRWLSRILLVYSIACAAAALSSAYLYDLMLLKFFPPLFLVVFAAITRTIYRAYRTTDSVEISWMMAGFAVVAINALLHLCSVAIIPVFWWLQHWFPPMRLWNNTHLFWSMFLLLICFVRVMYGRYDQLNQELAAFNRRLEDMVKERTAQLEEANEQLAISMRDSAEAMASALVLEERQRIAYTIHDTVGHTLTATIVQMEAAKRLLDKDPDLAKAKFDASQQLVRKGLDEIRGSVRLLQEDPAQYDLNQAMERLMAETSEATGVVIERHIERMPEQLTILQKRVLYHALQEGLTNGIRHGRCDRFGFVLTWTGNVVTFRLNNNGLPYTAAEFGFGLKAMQDRVLQLGGTLRISAAEQGCNLTLVLPVRSA